MYWILLNTIYCENLLNTSQLKLNSNICLHMQTLKVYIVYRKYIPSQNVLTLMVVGEGNPLLVFSVTWHVVNVSDTFYPQRSLVSYRIEHAKLMLLECVLLLKNEM